MAAQALYGLFCGFYFGYIVADMIREMGMQNDDNDEHKFQHSDDHDKHPVDDIDEYDNQLNDDLGLDTDDFNDYYDDQHHLVYDLNNNVEHVLQYDGDHDRHFVDDDQDYGDGDAVCFIVDKYHVVDDNFDDNDEHRLFFNFPVELYIEEFNMKEVTNVYAGTIAESGTKAFTATIAVGDDLPMVERFGVGVHCGCLVADTIGVMNNLREDESEILDERHPDLDNKHIKFFSFPIEMPERSK